MQERLEKEAREGQTGLRADPQHVLPCEEIVLAAGLFLGVGFACVAGGSPGEVSLYWCHRINPSNNLFKITLARADSSSLFISDTPR